MKHVDRIEQESRGWQAQLTDSDIAAIRRWRAADRFYESVQRALADPGEVAGEAVDVADRLVSTVLTHPLKHEYTAWRGVRSTAATFGVTKDQLAGRSRVADEGNLIAHSPSPTRGKPDGQQ